MNTMLGQFHNNNKRNWGQQKCGSYGKCCKSHGLQRSQMKQISWTAKKSNETVLQKETGGNRNVVPVENAANLMDCKEVK